MLAAFLPLTIFYFLMLFCNFNITSSHFRSFVFYSQAISMPLSMRALLIDLKDNIHGQTAIRYIYMFYGMWNLDLLRSMNLNICLDISSLQTLAIDLVVAIYPLLLMILTYLLIHLYDNNFIPLV